MYERKRVFSTFVLLNSLVFILYFTWNAERGIHSRNMSLFTRAELVAFRHKGNETSKRIHRNIYHRIDTTPEKTGKLPFLENYKNPCWHEAPENRSETRMRTRCLPYFYLVGAPKCGTTDLHARLAKHPLISSAVKKEPHWLTRRRFYNGQRKNLSEYLSWFDLAVDRDITQIGQNGYFNAVFGDCSASTMWDISMLIERDNNGSVTLPSYTNADIIHRLNSQSKILILLRNPITRLYSEYLYQNELRSVEEFHNKVIDAINFQTTCLKLHSRRHCVYTASPIAFEHVRLQVGFYHIYIEDFMQVFPRDQIKVLRLEDYSKNIKASMTEVFEFLDIGLPSEEVMLRICNQTNANTNTKRRQYIGEMLPKTFEILYKFYKPYNDRLVQLLGQNFSYN